VPYLPNGPAGSARSAGPLGRYGTERWDVGRRDSSGRLRDTLLLCGPRGVCDMAGTRVCWLTG
jgi:hypothetical protein